MILSLIKDLVVRWRIVMDWQQLFFKSFIFWLSLFPEPKLL